MPGAVGVDAGRRLEEEDSGHCPIAVFVEGLFPFKGGEVGVEGDGADGLRVLGDGDGGGLKVALGNAGGGAILVREGVEEFLVDGDDDVDPLGEVAGGGGVAGFPRALGSGVRGGGAAGERLDGLQAGGWRGCAGGGGWGG